MTYSTLARAVIIASAAASLGAPAFAQTSAPASAAAKLDRAAVDALLAKPGSVTFLDVRRADEIADIGGLPVFLNVQLAELDSRAGWIARDKPVVTVSNHAGRAGKAAAALIAKGYAVAGLIGVEDYAAQGGVLSKRPPAKTAAAK